MPSKFHLISVFNVLFSQDELILYTRMQLKLQYVVTLDEGGALEELMGLVEKGARSDRNFPHWTAQVENWGNGGWS